MNKFSLKFRDCQTENEYQDFLCNSQRRFTFILVSFAFAFNYGLRIILCFTDDDYTLFYFKLGLFIYVVTQFFIVRMKPKYIRHAFIMINLSNLLINFQTDSNTTLSIQNLKGANSMAAGFLVLLSGEFPEAAFIFTIQTVYRILIVFVLDDVLNLGTMTTSILLNLCCFFYFYQYHQARRSQYLLGRVNSDWDKILNDLIQIPYILLKFNYEELNYHVIKQNKFPFYLNEKQESDIINFLHCSLVKKQCLSNIIYEYIQAYQKKPQDFFKKQIEVIFNKQIVQIEISIFYSPDPQILLKFKVKQPNRDFQYSQVNLMKFHSLNEVFLNLIKQLNKRYRHKSLVVIQRKLIRVRLLHSLTSSYFKIQQISIKKALKVMKHFFPELKLKYNRNIEQVVETMPNTLFFILLQIFEYSINQRVNCELITLMGSVQLKLDGQFNSQKLKKLIQTFQSQMNQIFELLEIESNRISLYFRKEPLLSFYMPIAQERTAEQGFIVSQIDEHHLLNNIN